MVVFTPVLGAIFLGQRLPAMAWAAAAVSAAGLYLLSGAGGGLELRGDGLVLLCAIAFAAHILVTDRAVGDHDVGALLVVQLTVVRAGLPGRGGRRRPARGAARRDGVVGAAGHVAGGQRARLLRPDLRPAQRAAGPHRPDPGQRARVRRACSATCWPTSAWAWSPGWARRMILAAIVAVEVVPRLRPPRPLPEG